MNAITVVLVVLAVHFGGVDLDTARDVPLQWFEDARQAGAWTLDSRENGVYRFTGEGEILYVHRQPEPDLVYTVTVQPFRSGIERIGTVVLDAAAVGETRAFRSRGVFPDDVLVAFAVAPTVALTGIPVAEGTASGSTASGAAASSPAASSPTDANGAEAATEAAYRITRSGGVLTAAHAESGQIVTLRVQ